MKEQVSQLNQPLNENELPQALPSVQLPAMSSKPTQVLNNELRKKTTRSRLKLRARILRSFHPRAQSAGKLY